MYKPVALSMKPSLSTRIIAVVLAISSLLCMQFALAAYVCPGMAQSGVMMMDNAAMPGCDGMDMNQTALCHAHALDQSSKQTVDNADLPPVTPFIPSQLVQTLLPVVALAPSRHTTYAVQYPSHSPAPPIAILHCCFRI